MGLDPRGQVASRIHGALQGSEYARDGRDTIMLVVELEWQ